MVDAPSPRHRSSRWLGRLLSALALVVMVLGLQVPSAVAAPLSPPGVDARHGRCSIVGTWSATVYRDTGEVERGASLTFARDGSASAVGSAGEGHGTWAARGSCRYSYVIETALPYGSLTVSARVIVRGDHLGGAGSGTAYDPDGNALGSSQSFVVAERRSQ